MTAASDLGEVMSKSAQIFGQEALPELEAFAAGAARSFGQSKTQALDAAATFAVFGKSAGLTGKDLTGFSKDLVELTADMASFSNTTPEEAIEAVGAALRGESEPIRRYGVLLDDATLRNRALALGLISTTKDALTPQNKVLAAQAEILAQTSDVQGDFARTSGGLANQQRILNALLEDGKVKLGQALLPAVTAVVSFLVSTGIPAFQEFTATIRERVFPVLAQAGAIFKEFFSALTTGFTENEGTGIERVALAIRDAFFTARDGVLEAVNAMRTGMTVDEGTPLERAGLAIRAAFLGTRDVLVEVFDFVRANQDTFAVAGAGVATAAGSFFLLSHALRAVAAAQAAITAVQAAGGISGIVSRLTTALPLLLSPVGLLVVAIAALAVAGFVAYQKFKPFRDLVDAIARTVRDVAVVAFERLREVVEVVAPVIAGAFTAAVAGISTAFGGVRVAVGAVVATVSTVAQTVVAALTPIVVWIRDNLVTTFFAAGEAVAAFVGFAIGVISPFVEAWVRILSPILAFMADLFARISAVVSDGLGVVVAVAGTVLGFVFDLFGAFAATTLPIIVAFAQNLIDVVVGAFNVVKAGVESGLGVIRGVLQVFTGLFRGEWGKVWEGLETIVSSVLGGVVGIIRGILDTIRNVVSNSLGGLGDVARNAVGDLSGVLYGAGRDMILGLVDGIRSMAGAAADAARDAVAGAVGAVKGALRIGSPSKVFFELGGWTMEGFELGIAGKIPDLRAQLGGVTNLVETTVRPSTAPSVAAPAPAVAATDSGGFPRELVVILDGKEIQRSVIRRERASR